MDKTAEVFTYYFDYKERLEAQDQLSEKEKSAIDDKDKLTRGELLNLAEDGMKAAFLLYNYDLALADVCNNLDLDITYFTDKKRGYMDAVDYIVAPQGSAAYFNQYDNGIPFWQKRLYKWKKIFVNRDSIIRFLTENMYITYIDNGVEQEALIDVNMANYLIENNVLYRRCNMKELVLKRKRNDFIRKTQGDIAMYKKKMITLIGLSDELLERCEREVEMLKKLSYKDLALTANNKEVTDYIANNEHQRLYLRGDKDVTLYMFSGRLS